MDLLGVANLIVSGIVVPIAGAAMRWSFKANREMGEVRTELAAIKEKLGGNGRGVPGRCAEHEVKLQEVNRRLKALEGA